MAATSSTFVGGETAGALFVPWKTALGARINGAWATSRRSPGSRRPRHSLECSVPFVPPSVLRLRFSALAFFLRLCSLVRGAGVGFEEPHLGVITLINILCTMEIRNRL